MRIVHVVGARPNFIKIAPIMAALRDIAGIEQLLVHTGQHYDHRLSQVFFGDLGLPQPDLDLGVGSGSHAFQIGNVMIAFEQACQDIRPDVVVVVGDVNSTLACALVAAKLRIPCAHVEAGLRSGDHTMPEEINRVVTDRLCDLLLTPSADADENLLKEGLPPTSIVRVGNVMIDSLQTHIASAKNRPTLAKLDLTPDSYALMTLHRPSNVDHKDVLERLLDMIAQLPQELPVVLPIHPRTHKRLTHFKLMNTAKALPNLRIIEPQGYLDFLALTASARFVMTDSGGLQEETTALGVPCLTLRENTERPITVSIGTNILVGTDPFQIVTESKRILAGHTKQGSIPELWDGNTGPRIAKIIEEHF